MSLDKASMVITGSILPIEIQKKFTGGTFEYDNLGVVSLNKLSIPYKLSLNTLIKYKIIKKL